MSLPDVNNTMAALRLRPLLTRCRSAGTPGHLKTGNSTGTETGIHGYSFQQISGCNFAVYTGQLTPVDFLSTDL